MTDEELVKGCIKENRSSQDMLYNIYAGKLMTVCYRYMENRMDAEDVLQEGFIKIFDNISKFRFHGSLEGWMKRIMANTSINRLRKKDLLKGTQDPNMIDTPINESIIEKLDGETLIGIIQKLPVGYRTVFNMFAIEGYSHKEIAQELGIEEVSSRTQLSKAKKVLQKQILEFGGFIENEF
jgi:RNA polymerase sigma-70 factor (ECF subfamily)